MKEIADLNLIKWLLENQTGYQISKELGIRETTVSSWRRGVTPLTKMSLENAIKLTEYAEKIKGELKMKNEIKEYFTGTFYDNGNLEDLTNFIGNLPKEELPDTIGEKLKETQGWSNSWELAASIWDDEKQNGCYNIIEKMGNFEGLKKWVKDSGLRNNELDKYFKRGVYKAD